MRSPIGLYGLIKNDTVRSRYDPVGIFLEIYLIIGLLYIQFDKLEIILSFVYNCKVHRELVI